MLLPAVGFDMAPTDCLAVHLKRWLPSATFLTLAFQVEDPAGLPAGTQRTAIELIPYGDSVRRNGRLVAPERRVKICPVDFGRGPVQATRLTWGDVLAAYFSTGIPNIEDYAVLPKALRSWPAICDPCSGWRPCVICLNEVSGRERRPTSASAPRCMCGAKSKTRKVAARSHACTAGRWTRVDLAIGHRGWAEDIERQCPPGFQTPGMAYGADFILECEGVTREDVA